MEKNCTKLRADNPDLKVIIMSAYDQLECDISKFTFVSKPIPIVGLLKIVKDTLTEAIQTAITNVGHKHNII